MDLDVEQCEETLVGSCLARSSHAHQRGDGIPSRESGLGTESCCRARRYRVSKANRVAPVPTTRETIRDRGRKSVAGTSGVDHLYAESRRIPTGVERKRQGAFRAKRNRGGPKIFATHPT